MIQFRLRELMARKGRVEQRRITYALIKEHTRIWPSTLSRLANNSAEQIGLSVIDRLCDFFACTPGDLIVHVSNDGTGAETTARDQRVASRAQSATRGVVRVG